MKKLITALTISLICNSAFSEITSLTIDSATVSKSTGEISVSGTVICTKDNSFFLGGTLYQIKGPNFSTGGGSIALTCTGDSPDSWTIDSPPSSEGIPIAPGNAQFAGTAIDNDGIEQFIRKVHVKPVP